MFKRLLFLVYGLTCYLIFLGTFLYAIAFVGGFFVPSRLDGPLHSPLGWAVGIDCGLLTVFALQNSIMARQWFKERWAHVVPWTIERSTFVLCASLALDLLFWQWRPIGAHLKDFAVTAMLSGLQRQPSGPNPILCHGNAGILPLIRRFYERTRDSAFISHLEILTASVSRSVTGFEHSEPAKRLGLLEGIAGIGIALCADIDTGLSWDRAFAVA